MTTKITIFISAALLAIPAFKGYSQDRLPCATDHMVKRSLEAHPELLADYLAEEQRLAQLDQEAYKTGYQDASRAPMPAPYIIPVVFHILHQNGPENISDAQVIDAVRVMNEDYSKTNADFANTVSTFIPVAADCQISFALAKKDPTGACTNGIDRIYSALTNNGDDGAKLNPWPRNKYLNIWVVKTMADAGVAGYSYFPGTAFPSSVDGIIILNTYIGAIGTGSVTRAHALSHEAGHYLNLRHCWGNTNDPGVDCSGTDNVSDTPTSIGWSSCNLSANDVCTTGVEENVQNFMEYSYCSTMFTAGQRTRMQNALSSSTGQRNQLSTTTNLAATGVSSPAVLCTANFETDNPVNTICAGDSLSFTDLSWNGTPTSWAWSFSGGTPSTSTSSAPTVVYSTSGIYDVSLTVSDASGSVTATKTSYIYVNPASAMFSGPAFIESFEGSAMPAGWQVHNSNSGSNTWVQTSTAAASGSKSMMITNASSYDGFVDELMGPSVNMSMITGTPTLTFKVAHAQKTSTSADKLQVYVSTTCGQSWTLRKTLTGSALSTAGVQSAAFTPTSSQWAFQSVNLTGYSGNPNLYFMFRFTSNAGNNVFLDDINLIGNVGVDELSNTINFTVFPNPAEDNTVVYFDLIEKQEVTLEIYDLVGRKVSSMYQGKLNEGEHQFQVASEDMSAGAYIVRLTAGTHSFSKKLIVK
jgi:PKD repeat protein